MTKKAKLPKTADSTKTEQKSADAVSPKIEETQSKPNARPGSFAELISK